MVGGKSPDIVYLSKVSISDRTNFIVVRPTAGPCFVGSPEGPRYGLEQRVSEFLGSTHPTELAKGPLIGRVKHKAAGPDHHQAFKIIINI